MSSALIDHLKVSSPNKDKIRILTSYLIILFWIIATAQIYVYYNYDDKSTTIYNSFEALGAVLIGCLSDKFCRRKTVLFNHLIGTIFFSLVIFWKMDLIFFCIIGLFYSPLPVVRAALMDNSGHISKMKLLAYSFVVQNIPWALYVLFSDLKPSASFQLALGTVCFSLILVVLFFSDKKDLNLQEVHKSEKKLIPNHKTILKFTVFAAIPSQIVFFVSDNLLQSYSINPLFYSILSFGSVVGAYVASLYRKTPHSSVLTVSYGISMMIAILPFASHFIYLYKNLELPSLFIVFACLGGFGLPFIYDIVLSSVFARYRGTFCGLLDGLFSMSSLCSNALTSFLNLTLFTTLISIPILFAIAMFLQKRAESLHANE